MKPFALHAHGGLLLALVLSLAPALPAAAATLSGAPFAISPVAVPPTLALEPKVAWLDDETFVVVWQRLAPEATDDTRWDMMMRTFAADGTPFGEERRFAAARSQFSTDTMAIARIAPDRFVVVWTDHDYFPVNSGLGLAFDIYGQVFATSGEPTTLRFPVNAEPVGDQIYPRVAALPSERFLVVWRSRTAGVTDGADILAQRFGLNGRPVGTPARVNAVTTGLQSRPAVACSPAGRCLVAWGSATDSEHFAVKGQYLNAALTPQGPEFPIASDPVDYFSFPKVAMDDAGSAVVTWQFNNPWKTLHFARYRANQTLLTASRTISSPFTEEYPEPPTSQAFPATRPDGAFGLVWSESINGRTRVYLRDYPITGPALPRLTVHDWDMSRELRAASFAVNSQGRGIVIWVEAEAHEGAESAFLHGMIVTDVGGAP